MRELAKILARIARDFASTMAAEAWDATKDARCALLCDRHSHESLRRQNAELRAELETERRCNRYVARARERSQAS